MIKDFLKGAGIGLVLVGMFVGLTLATSWIARKYAKKEVGKFKKQSSIVKLTTLDGSFFCTGTVISPTLLVTAAHCVQNAPVDEYAIMLKNEKGQNTGTLARVFNFNARSDLALLEGDFLDFEQIPISYKAEETYNLIKNGNYKTCGYPWGGELICQTLTLTNYYDFKLVAKGLMIPGMSGGPVIEIDSGKIVAVNYGMYQENYIMSPTIEIFALLGVNFESK